MSSDSRWTGGVANREWQRGTTPQPVTDTDALTRKVKQYLRDCRTYRALLNSDHHPTVEGCLKIVYHHGDAQKQAIIAAYTEAVARTTVPGQTYRRPCCDHCNNLAGDPAGHDYTLNGPHEGPCEQCAAERARREHDEGTS